MKYAFLKVYVVNQATEAWRMLYVMPYPSKVMKQIYEIQPQFCPHTYVQEFV